MEKTSLIISGDGSHTLYLEDIGETYHSRFGALEESEVVYINAGYRFLKEMKELNLFEMGFGTGLNCLLTALEAQRLNIVTHYYTIEKYPLPDEIINRLNYPEITGEKGNEIWQKIHSPFWGKSLWINPVFELKKIRGDVLSFSWSEFPDFDLVYFDAFAPGKQPEIWNIRLFTEIYSKLKKGAVIVTYSAKGSVRRDMERTGLKVERLPGPTGKREMLRGLKI